MIQLRPSRRVSLCHPWMWRCSRHLGTVEKRLRFLEMFFLTMSTDLCDDMMFNVNICQYRYESLDR